VPSWLQRNDNRREAAWLLVIVVGGALLRLWGLASWQWEQDELYTLRDALTLPLASGTSPGIGGRPLYYVLQHLLLSVSSPTPLALRAPAFLFGVAGIVAAWAFGRRAFGATAGLMAAFLTAISPWHLYASQFARYWSLVFLLSAAAFALLLRLGTQESRRGLLATALILLLGSLTHPTFLFPLIGVIAAAHLLRPNGRLGIVWPSSTAWRYLWLPFGLLLGSYLLFIKLGGYGSALRNMEGRGLLATLRLVPAMVQWAPLEAIGGALFATAYLVTGRSGLADRRIGMMVLLGGASGLGLLLASSLSTGVYADYGIAMLPLAFVAVGGLAQRSTDRLAPGERNWIVAGMVVILGLAAAPGVASHLRDGSRFDYRSAYQAINRLGPQYPVTGGIDALREVYSPTVDHFSITMSQDAGRPINYWLVVSFQRYGLREGTPRLQRAIDASCRRIESWERGRFDYRVYRVELHWCGTEPVPGSSPPILRTQPTGQDPAGRMEGGTP